MGNARFSLKVPGETAQAVVVLGHGGFADTQVGDDGSGGTRQ